MSKFLLDLHELPRRAGEYKDFHLNLTLDQPLGLEMVAIPAGGKVTIDVTATSVDEGVLVRGGIKGGAEGECARCLSPLAMEVDQRFDELYEYPSKAAALSEDEVETDQILLVTEDHVDLEVPIRDALLLALPVNPLCEIDCPGLCSECGIMLREAPQDHHHEVVDDRWSTLSDLSKKLRGEGQPPH